MSKATKGLLALGAAALALGLATGGNARAATAVETLYADLAKLPAEERMKKIVEGAAKEGQVTAAPAFRGKVGDGHVSLFKKRYSNLKVETTDMNTEAVVERYIAEETAGRHLMDAIGVTTADINIVLRKDLAARYPTPATAAVLARYKNFLDAENRWVPWYWSEHGISYNANALTKDQAPKSYEDFCAEKFRGNVSYEPGETKWLVGMYLYFGEEKFNKWLDCVGKNQPVVMKGHDLRITLMFSGDHLVQGDNFLYAGYSASMKNPKKAPFGMVLTEQAPVMARAGVTSINPNTPHPYAAALWTDWHLTDESQKYIHAEYRGPLAITHPFLGDETPLFVFGVVPEEVNAKVNAAWKQYIGSKR
jgi:ABC-type Fe3+ transport system substrate-binding protein